MSDCLFCKFASGEIPTNKAYEDDTVLAFYDIAPQAPVHILVIPKRHIVSAQTLTPDDAALWLHMIEIVQHIAAEKGIDKTGYRLVTNIGSDAGQSVPHLHLHLLGGRTLEWPPG